MTTKRLISGFAALVMSLTVGASLAVAQPKKLKASTFLPGKHYATIFFGQIVGELNTAAQGEVSIELYHSEALGRSTEQLDILLEGLADMSFSVAALFKPARFTLCSFIELPFISTSVQNSTKILQELVARDLITEEFAGTKLLAAYNTPPAQLFSNKPLETLADFKGLRVIGQGPVWTRTWSLLGAQGVAMSWPDVYLALERGTVDAAPSSWSGMKGWKWAEVIKHPIEIGLMGGFFNSVVMNQKAWEALPPEVKTAWARILSGMPARFANLADKNEAIGRQYAESLNRKTLLFPAREREKMAQDLMPIWNDWLERNEKAKKPARQVYQTYVDVMRKAGEPVVMKIPGLYQ